MSSRTASSPPPSAPEKLNITYDDFICAAETDLRAIMRFSSFVEDSGDMYKYIATDERCLLTAGVRPGIVRECSGRPLRKRMKKAGAA